MEPVSSIVFSLYRDTPQHGEWVVACLQGAWPALLGESLARVCSPSAYAHPTLHIVIHEAAWRETLHSLKSEIERKLRTATAGEVRIVKFLEPSERAAPA